MAIAISVEGLSKRYRIGEFQGAYGTLRDSFSATTRRLLQREHGHHQEEIWALQDVSFDVAEGGVLAVIGRNGAGKSTLLKILTRITTPTRGRATIRGRVGSLLEVGTGFHPELTGRENVFLNGSLLGMKRREIIKKFPEILEFAGVEQVHRHSGEALFERHVRPACLRRGRTPGTRDPPSRRGARRR